MKKVLLLLFLILYLSGVSQFQWDLQHCINYALNHNISIKQVALNNELNKNNTIQSKAAVLPSINLGASHLYNFGQTIDRFTNTFANTQVLSQNFFTSANVLLWSGLSQYNTIKANEFNYLSGVEKFKQKQNELSISIANAYIGVIFSEEIYKVSLKQYEISEEQLKRTENLVIAGVVSKSVEYDIKSQLANDKVNLITADNNYNLSILNLKQLMNFDSVTVFNIKRPEIIIQDSILVENDINSIYEKSLKNQPIVKSGQYAILSAEKSLLSNKGRISPTLSFNASMGTGTSGLAKDIIGVNYYGYRVTGITNKGDSVFSPLSELITKNKVFSDQFIDNVNKSIGFTLSIPIFNGLQTYTSIKNAQINVLNSKLSLDLIKQDLFKNIQQAKADAKAALNKYNATKLSLEASKESFKYATQKLNQGVISAFDFNSAKNRLFASESNLLQSKYDYIFKLKVLDYYQGIPLGF